MESESESFLSKVPTLIKNSIIQKLRLLTPNVPEILFKGEDILTSPDSLEMQFYCNVFFLQKKVRGASINTIKTLVEQISVEIQAYSWVEEDNEAASAAKRYTLEKSISSFIVNSPFFSLVRQEASQQIEPVDFEITITFEPAKGELVFEKEFETSQIENHTIILKMLVMEREKMEHALKEHLKGCDRKEIAEDLKELCENDLKLKEVEDLKIETQCEIENRGTGVIDEKDLVVAPFFIEAPLVQKEKKVSEKEEFDGSLKDCVQKLREYQNNLDGKSEIGIEEVYNENKKFFELLYSQG